MKILGGVILFVFSIIMYASVNFESTFLPNGSIWIGLGLNDNVIPTSTKMVVDAGSKQITMSVDFTAMKNETVFAWMMLPYLIENANSSATYQNRNFNGNSSGDYGKETCYSQNFPEKSSSIVNVTFTPDTTHHSFIPFYNMQLSIFVIVNKIISIASFSRQTVILTFFGNIDPMWSEEMSPYMGINSFYMYDYPFSITVQFPIKYFLSSETFPQPISLYATDTYKAAFFSLNFSNPKNYGQSISCSFTNPKDESLANYITFISGAVLGIGAAVVAEEILESLRTHKKSLKQRIKELEKEKLW